MVRLKLVRKKLLSKKRIVNIVLSLSIGNLTSRKNMTLKY